MSQNQNKRRDACKRHIYENEGVKRSLRAINNFLWNPVVYNAQNKEIPNEMDTHSIGRVLPIYWELYYGYFNLNRKIFTFWNDKIKSQIYFRMLTIIVRISIYNLTKTHR